jgi:hypothetical protein
MRRSILDLGETIMKKVKVVSVIVLSILLIVGFLDVSGHAAKPPSPPGQSKLVQISVSGAIEGTGDPAHMGIEFIDTFGGDVGTQVSNPDGPLAVFGTRKGPRTLRYYYCDAVYHDDPDQCDNPREHDPSNYKALMIYGGALEGKKETERIVFPAGSEWEVRSKVFMGVESYGTLENEVIYRELN